MKWGLAKSQHEPSSPWWQAAAVGDRGISSARDGQDLWTDIKAGGKWCANTNVIAAPCGFAGLTCVLPRGLLVRFWKTRLFVSNTFTHVPFGIGWITT